MQEYWRISSLSDAEIQYLDKQKIQDLVGGSIIVNEKQITKNRQNRYAKSSVFNAVLFQCNSMHDPIT